MLMGKGREQSQHKDMDMEGDAYLLTSDKVASGRSC